METNGAPSFHAPIVSKADSLASESTPKSELYIEFKRSHDGALGHSHVRHQETMGRAARPPETTVRIVHTPSYVNLRLKYATVQAKS